ncbi:hypothetical protein V5O48_003084 [Marasmius crinis-equi]|uniref:XPG-I domain-containing protein n=1 Tax=Marasmius crinis-equi TaxID=585013 RepID=A0ABR3FTX8_9AGAR
MGVLGLTPFLQKTIPTVIKQLPDRLRGLSGKTIVLHVLGWYRIIQELRSNDVEAICIFDGKERNAAKAKEALRRKEAMRLVLTRQVIEGERLNRLVQLQGALSRVDWNNTSQRAQLSERLQSVISTKEGSQRDIDVEDVDWFAEHGGIHDSMWSDSIPDLSPVAISSSNVGFPYRGVYALPDALMNEEEVLTSLTEVYDSSRQSTVTPPPSNECTPSQTSNLKPTSSDNNVSNYDVSEHDIISILHDEHDISSTLPPIQSPTAPNTQPMSPENLGTPVQQPSFDDIPEILVSLFNEYRNSIPKVTSVSRAARLSDTESESVEHEMSRSQYQLTKDEGIFWTAFTFPALAEATADPNTLLSTLRNKSSVLSESYTRRANPPTTQNYAEAKEILRAMGVPCIDVEGAFEAEAVAASFVLNGLADYVASEDTDVLVYGAPLLRNITSRRDPLTFVSGADIQTMLELSREKFIDFALLLGTDFSQRIKNIGPARALKFIRAHGSIEKIVETETKYPPTLPHDEYFQQIDAGRAVFQALPPVQQFERVEPDQAKTNFLMGKYGLTSELEDYWEHALEGNYFHDNPNNSDAISAGF